MLSSISSLSGSALTISTLLFIFNFYPQEGKQIAFFSYLTVSLISFTYNGKNDYKLSKTNYEDNSGEIKKLPTNVINQKESTFIKGGVKNNTY